MNSICIVTAVAFALFSPLTVCAQELWTSKDGSIRNVDTRALYADGQKMYLATRTELYASGGPKGKWESIFFIPGSDNEIACIGGSAGHLYVGTRRGLFGSQDGGRTWINIFKMVIQEKSSVLTIAVSPGVPGRIMIGTGRGLYSSDDNGARWRHTGPALKNRRVKSIAFSGPRIFAGTDDGLYLSTGAVYDWRRVFVCNNPSDDAYPAEEIPEPIESEERADPGISSIAVKGATVYIASGKRISYSDDAANSWKRHPDAGLRGSVNCMLAAESSDKLYCATTKGVFEYDAGKNKWNELYNGMAKAANVRKIAFSGRDEKALWAGTDKGVYRLVSVPYAEESYVDIERNLNAVKMIFAGEPSFEELQKAAIRFNDLSPDKIRKWHMESRLRALAPKVSVGFDNARSNSYEIYTSATKDYTIAGPDDISEGFDLSVSWDLANIIWSQTRYIPTI
ncbi:MAG: hypothetical protein V1682_03760 [Candidatus Omnitrophota bacterium]